MKTKWYKSGLLKIIFFTVDTMLDSNVSKVVSNVTVSVSLMYQNSLQSTRAILKR